MSALLDDALVLDRPEPVRRPAALRLVVSNDLAEPYVPALRRVPPAAPVRLTRRGVVVLAGAVAILAVALVWFAWLSAPSGAGPVPAPAVAGDSVAGDSVAVAPGDSLWSIAERVAPDRDPRAEVAVLQRLNHLDGSSILVPGQVLRIH